MSRSASSATTASIAAFAAAAASARLTELTFDSDSLLNSGIRDPHLTRAYTTSTPTGASVPRQPTVLSANPGLPAAQQSATLNWKSREMTIGGTTRAVDGLKRKSNVLSGTRYWRWGSDGAEYKVRLVEGMWLASDASSGEPIASLTSVNQSSVARTTRSTAHHAHLPTLRLANSVRNEAQRQFLVLVLLYSETNRQDRE
ncbi:hypothetical protein HMN09_00361100 [Mycena chlorophos]|uniref:Uncharacterized protein n=1 Tax=Mycena chlorophos TaxID=658473 RepID=A0A8H6WKX6_MYCCL|nr:hypothetical protein HMN09_00361100 [Mycena chlorophos]